MKIVRSVLAFLLLAVGLGALAAPAVAYPAGIPAKAQINSTIFTRAATVVVTVQDATPGGVLTMTFFSSPVVIASGSVIGPNGTGSISGTIPANAMLGPHTISVNSTAGEAFVFPVSVIASSSGATSVDVMSGCQDPPEDATDGFIGVTVRNDYRIDQNYRVVVAPGAADESFTLAAGQSRTVFAGDLANGAYEVSVSGAELSGTSAPVTIVCSGPNPPTTPPTTTPTVPPSGTSTPSATATVTLGSSGGTGGSGKGSGDLASTGSQVGLGAGLGLAALVGGGVLLVASRRRSVPRHGA